MAPDQYVAAFVQTMDTDLKFPVGYHVPLKSRSDVAMDARVHKFQANQVILSLSVASTPSAMDDKEMKLKRTKSIETLLTGARSEVKRLRLVKTDDGTSF